MPVKPKSVLEVRIATEEECAELKTWRKLHKEVDEFIFIWSRWKNWEDHPPIVALLNGKLVGYHGFNFTKTMYVNSVSQFVKEEARGNRIAGAMIDILFRKCFAEGKTRLRFRCPVGGLGMDCWSGFGVKPFGKGEKDYWFDINIENISCIEDFIESASTLHIPPTPDKRRHTYYRKSNLTPLIPSYRKILKDET